MHHTVKDLNRPFARGRLPTLLAAAVVATTAPFFPACASKEVAFDNSLVDLSLRPSNTAPVAGDTITVSSLTRNIEGRDPKIAWAASGGDVRPIENGRAARVRFDRPGTFTVSAVMTLDDGAEFAEEIAVVVQPVP